MLFPEEASGEGVWHTRDRAVFIHLTLVPYIKSAGELKTKPTQHSVKELREIGIQPDILLCRAERSIPEEERRKIALFTNVPFEAVISAIDSDSIYKMYLREVFARCKAVFDIEFLGTQPKFLGKRVRIGPKDPPVDAQPVPGAKTE